MGFNLELIFKIEDFEKQIPRSTETILVTVETVLLAGMEVPVLRAIAVARDNNGTPARSIKGCPTPCHPITDSDCGKQSEKLLQFYIQKEYFKDL